MAFGPDRSSVTRTHTRTAEGIDAGLRSYMLSVYNYMSLGVGLTGAVAFFIASNPAAVEAVFSLSWVLFLGVIGLGWFAPRIIQSKSVATGHVVYWVYAGLWGALLAPTFFVYLNSDPMLLVRAFLITSATFAGMSLFGYTTKRDLSPMAAFFTMAIIGLIIAMVVNLIFVESSLFSLLTSSVAVLLFSGVTAYETQMIKEMYTEGDDEEVHNKKAIFGALTLYASFIVLFVHILNILSILRD